MAFSSASGTATKLGGIALLQVADGPHLLQRAAPARILVQGEARGPTAEGHQLFQGLRHVLMLGAAVLLVPPHSTLPHTSPSCPGTPSEGRCSGACVGGTTQKLRCENPEQNSSLPPRTKRSWKRFFTGLAVIVSVELHFDFPRVIRAKLGAC